MDFEGIEGLQTTIRYYPLFPWDKDFKEEFSIPPQLEEKFRTGNIRIGVDFDCTLDKAPYLFKRLFDKVRACGGKVFLLTGREYKDEISMRDVLQFVSFFDIGLDGIFFYDLESHLGDRFKIACWKLAKIQELGIEVFIDDDPIVFTLLRRKLPQLLILSL
jgi:hypothetical protein